MRLECPETQPPPQEKTKYLKEITAACTQLALDVKASLADGELPVVLGGDHSIAIGSVAGVTSFYRGRGESGGAPAPKVESDSGRAWRFA